MKKVLLHICCGVCASVAIKRLKEEGFYVSGFFFNPNIHPQAEYNKRKANLKIIKKIFGIEIIEGLYEPKQWFKFTRVYAREKEGGKRCSICYALRLRESFLLCRNKGFDFFTTTLTISPHKKSSTISTIGKKIGGTYFLERDFKKKDGFKEAMIFAKKYDLYRQNYCGCIYSLLERKKKDKNISSSAIK